MWFVHSLTRQTHTVDPFDSYPVAVYCIGILLFGVISVHHFHDCTQLSGGDPLYIAVAPLCYAVATWHLSAMLLPLGT